MNSSRRLRLSASDKRPPRPRRSEWSKAFAKDWDRLWHTGRYDLSALKEVMLLLIANDGPLGAEWRDHPLKGEWRHHRECHIGGDFLLIYRLDTDCVVFVRAGSHSELFRT